MTITISAFAWVPSFAQGYVKDLRPRWALAEAGLDHRIHAVAGDEANGAAYRAWQPFGQVPAYRDDEVELFDGIQRAEEPRPGVGLLLGVAGSEEG